MLWEAVDNHALSGYGTQKKKKTMYLEPLFYINSYNFISIFILPISLVIIDKVINIFISTILGDKALKILLL